MRSLWSATFPLYFNLVNHKNSNKVSALSIFNVRYNELLNEKLCQLKDKVRHELYTSCDHWMSVNCKYCTKSTSLICLPINKIFFVYVIMNYVIDFQSFMHPIFLTIFSFVNDILTVFFKPHESRLACIRKVFLWDIFSNMNLQKDHVSWRLTYTCSAALVKLILIYLMTFRMCVRQKLSKSWRMKQNGAC